MAGNRGSMAADVSSPGIAPGGLPHEAAIRSGTDMLRTLAVAAGLACSVLFVVVGLGYQLQLYGDGSLFSYAVAVRDAWAFHWHNISARLFVYLFSLLPAETYVGLTGDARGGIALYGFLFFAAPLLGLAATFVADRSKGRIIFVYACFSTALLCPLVFGFPTEMWIAHALFWPTLTLAHYARSGIGGTALVLAAMLALVLTHEGALIFAAAIVATLLLRGARDAAFVRAAVILLVAILVWAAVRVTFPADEYFVKYFLRAAMNFFELNVFTNSDVLRLLLGTIASYAVVFFALRRLTAANAHIYAASIIAAGLAVYWLWFDPTLHAVNRYYLRTLLVLATPILGALAAVYALAADGRLALRVPLLSRLLAARASGGAARAIAGALMLVLLVHAVETAKFVTAWANYKAAVRALAMGAASDPALGDPRFVSSDRIPADLNRLSWFSTTHFLSVVVAPNFLPARLVVDRDADFVWLSCETATANAEADRVVPADSRRLVRAHECLHRRRRGPVR